MHNFLNMYNEASVDLRFISFSKQLVKILTKPVSMTTNTILCKGLRLIKYLYSGMILQLFSFVSLTHVSYLLFYLTICQNLMKASISLVSLLVLLNNFSHHSAFSRCAFSHGKVLLYLYIGAVKVTQRGINPLSSLSAYIFLYIKALITHFTP